MLGRKRRQRQRDVAYARQIKSLGDAARNPETASLRKKTLTRRARPACVGSLPVTESYSLSSCLRFRAQLSYAVLYIKCGRSESASTCRESEVGHSSLDVECVAVPRTHDPRPAVALFDVTLVQRTPYRKTLQHSPTDRINCLQTTGSM